MYTTKDYPYPNYPTQATRGRVFCVILIPFTLTINTKQLAKTVEKGMQVNPATQKIGYPKIILQ